MGRGWGKKGCHQLGGLCARSPPEGADDSTMRTAARSLFFRHTIDGGGFCVLPCRGPDHECRQTPSSRNDVICFATKLFANLSGVTRKRVQLCARSLRSGCRTRFWCPPIAHRTAATSEVLLRGSPHEACDPVSRQSISTKRTYSTRSIQECDTRCAIKMLSEAKHNRFRRWSQARVVAVCAIVEPPCSSTATPNH